MENGRLLGQPRASSPLAQDDGLNFLRIGRSTPFDVQYFEVGNEIYGESDGDYWETDHHGSGGDTGKAHDPATYVAFAKQFATYAAEIDPGISIGVDTGSPTAGDYDNWTTNVLEQCAEQGFTPGFLSDHLYVQEPGTESDSTLLLDTVSDPSSSDDWANRAAAYRALLDQTLGAAGNNVELLATEFNSVSYNPGKQSTSLVNGLFIADSLGGLLETEYDGALVWDLHNYWDTSENDSSSLYGWREGGDYGILGGGDTTDLPSTGANVPYPSYFAEQLVSKIVHTNDTVVEASSNNQLLSVYAVRQADGDLDLLVINKDSNNNETAQLQFTGFQPSGSATVWQYGKTQDNAQSQSSDGSSALANFTTTLATNGSAFSESFPSYSMTVLDLQPAAPLLNLGGTGGNFAATFTVGGGPVPIVDPNNLTITDPNASELSGATITITNPLDGPFESLAVTTTGTNISASYSAGELTLSGTDTLADYRTVLRTLVYDDTASTPDLASRTINVIVTDAIADVSAAVTSTVSFDVLSTSLLDPGFESPALGAGPAAYQYDPAGSPWTFSGYAGVTGNGSGFTAENPNAPQGNQAAFIQMTGSTSQSVNMAAGTYSISLDAAQRAIGPSNQTIEVLVDNAIVGTITPSSTSYSVYTTAAFFEAAGAHTIEILGLDPQGGDNTAFIDQVSIVSVQANQPLDPGFETPSLGSGPSAYQYDPTGSPWTFSGFAGVAGNASGFSAENPNAPQGNQVAFLQMTGSVSQSFVMAPGIYDVNLLAAQRGIGPSNQTIQVFVDGQLVSSVNPTGTSYASYASGSFVIGTEGSHTLTFQGLDPFGGDNTAFIDQVSVQNVTGNQPLDAGFETPFAGPSAYQYNATGSAWTFSGFAGVAGNASGFTAENPDAPQGAQVAFLQMTGSASQSVTLTGGTYAISLDAAQRAIGPSNQTIEVLVDNTPVSTIMPTSTNYSLYTTTTFTVTAGAHTIEILGLDPHGGDNTAFIDQVSIVAAQDNQPLDPGFEAPSLGAGAAAYQYDPSGSPWSFSGDAGVAGNYSGFTAGSPNAPQGGQVAFLQFTGSLSQSVVLAGGTYSISLNVAHAR